MVSDVERGERHGETARQLRQTELPAGHLLGDAVQVPIEVVLHVAHHPIPSAQVLQHHTPQHVIGEQADEEKEYDEMFWVI